MTARVGRRRRPAGLAVLAAALAVLAVALGGTSARGAVSLGTATSFAVLANTTITNTGASTVNGDVGVYPGTAVTGFGTVTRNGALHVGDAVAQQALVDAGAAYGALQSRTPCMDLTGQVLGQTVGTAGNPLIPGVYCFSSSAQLTGDLYLSGAGEYVFRIGSTLTTASGSHVILQNGAEACNIFWAVGSSATLGTNSEIVGTIIANVSITANTGAVVPGGRLFALTGAVTLDANTIGGMNCPPATASSTTAPPASSTTAPPASSTTALPASSTTALPASSTTALPASTTSTAAPATTTTTAAPGTTTTQAPGASTTTTGAPGATTVAPGSGATTTTLLPGPGTPVSGTTTTTTIVGAGSTTTPDGAGGTTAPVGAGGATATDQPSPGATTESPGAGTASPGASTPSPGATTASLGGLLSPADAGLRIQPLARTGQGLSGPLSVAVVSLFLGALMLLAPRREGVPVMAGPQLSGAGRGPGAAGHLRPRTSATTDASTVPDGARRGVRTAPGPSRPAPGPTPPRERVGQVAAQRPSDLMAALEGQLQEADARLARLRAMDHRS